MHRNDNQILLNGCVFLSVFTLRVEPDLTQLTGI